MLAIQIGLIVFFLFILGLICHDEYKKKRLSRKSVALDRFWHKLEERRQKVRINTQLGVLYEVLVDKKNRKYNSISRNISLGGVNLVLNEKLSSGTELRLQLDLPDEHKPVLTCGRVVWVKEISDKLSKQKKDERLFSTGIQFTHITVKDEKSLCRFIDHHIKTAATKS